MVGGASFAAASGTARTDGEPASAPVAALGCPSLALLCQLGELQSFALIRCASLKLQVW
jgi:hypothetical protein